MRIAFGQIPQTDLEEDIGIADDGITDDSIANDSFDGHELWLRRERQFKVMAEAAHRESRDKRRPQRT